MILIFHCNLSHFKLLDLLHISVFQFNTRIILLNYMKPFDDMVFIYTKLKLLKSWDESEDINYRALKYCFYLVYN